MRWLSATVLVLASLAVFRPAVALAAPTNDDFNSATVIGSLPFTDTSSVDGAVAAPDDPTACSNNDPDTELFWQAQASAGPLQATACVVGAPLLKAALLRAVAPYRTAAGGVRMQNDYRYLIAVPVPERR
jgi:hypothetical protein